MKRGLFIYGGLLLLVVAMGGYFYALSLQTAWEGVGSLRFKPDGAFLDAGGGRRLRYWCVGDGKPGVLLEATGASGADQYRALIPLISRYTRVCAYDRAGMGYSEPRTGPAKLADYTADLELVAKRTGEPPWILVGGSYGGVVVQAYAREKPQNVAALVLLDAVVPQAFEAMDAPWSQLDSSIRKAKLVAPSGLLRSQDPLELKDTQDAWLMYRASQWEGIQRLVSTREEAKTVLGKLPPLPKDLPLRVLRHTRVGDMMGPDFSLDEHQKLEPLWVKAQEEFAAQSSMGKVIPVDGAGHIIVAAAPELVKDTIVETMNRVIQRKEAMDAGVAPHVHSDGD